MGAVRLLRWPDPYEALGWGRQANCGETLESFSHGSQLYWFPMLCEAAPQRIRDAARSYARIMYRLKESHNRGTVGVGMIQQVFDVGNPLYSVPSAGERGDTIRHKCVLYVGSVGIRAAVVVHANVTRAS